MAFRIDYYKEGLPAGSTPHPGPQHETEKFAKDGFDTASRGFLSNYRRGRQQC
jgi:hypothetical protein